MPICPPFLPCSSLYCSMISWDRCWRSNLRWRQPNGSVWLRWFPPISIIQNCRRPVKKDWLTFFLPVVYKWNRIRMGKIPDHFFILNLPALANRQAPTGAPTFHDEISSSCSDFSFPSPKFPSKVLKFNWNFLHNYHKVKHIFFSEINELLICYVWSQQGVEPRTWNKAVHTWKKHGA